MDEIFTLLRYYRAHNSSGLLAEYAKNFLSRNLNAIFGGNPETIQFDETDDPILFSDFLEAIPDEPLKPWQAAEPFLQQELALCEASVIGALIWKHGDTADLPVDVRQELTQDGVFAWLFSGASALGMLDGIACAKLTREVVIRNRFRVDNDSEYELINQKGVLIAFSPGFFFVDPGPILQKIQPNMLMDAADLVYDLSKNKGELKGSRVQETLPGL